MCGIVGGVGKIDFRSYLIGGLKKLEYRGYDSSGLAYMAGDELKVYKISGYVADLDASVPEFSDAQTGIAHTRWATHGRPSQINSHPHLSQDGNFCIVHNGVIENFKALRQQLTVRGFKMVSQTDTEVLVDQIQRLYERGGSTLLAVREVMELLEGSYACALLSKYRPHRVYFMKNASPLVIGKGKDGISFYLASDASPMCEYTDEILDLQDGDYGYIEPGKIRLYHGTERIEAKFTKRDLAFYSNDLGGYAHHMIKEIEQTPSVMAAEIDNYFDGEKYTFDANLIEALRQAKKIHVLGCGTSYHAGLLGAKYLRYNGKNAECSIASEFAYDPYDIEERPFYILISQSGETADLIRCQKVLNDRAIAHLTITNIKGSTLERNATFSCLLYAGLEVAVASTKTYVATVLLFALLSGCLNGSLKALNRIDEAIDSVKDVIKRREKVKAIAERLIDSKDAFYVGRGYDYLVAMEGALKMKEIAYVHAESYPAGEIKHGPFALIEPNTPVIGMVSDSYTASGTRNNLEELEARQARIIVISVKGLEASGDAFVCKHVFPYLSPIVFAIVADYLAYYLALAKNLEIDKPRNLAKSVTVE